MEPTELSPTSSGSESDVESDDEHTLSEVEVMEDGTSKTVLVPSRTAQAHHTLPMEQADDDALGGVGYTEFFLSVVSSTRDEELVVRSPKGKAVGELFESIEKLQPGCVDSIAVGLTSEVYNCIALGRKHKLPSIAQGAVHSAFHRTRTGHSVAQAWKKFIDANPPLHSHRDNALALQILLDRILRKIVSNKAKSTAVQSSYVVRPLTFYDSNSVRYMAKYVAVKLLRKYNKASKNKNLSFKWKLFSRVLKRMKASEQPGYPDSLSSYSSLWEELIDRGGLYHISDETFHLFEHLELIVREHLNIPTVSVDTPTVNLYKVITEKVLSTERHVLALWERLSYDIPEMYEKYSLELLTKVTELWITVRGHSFAKGWNMRFEKKKQKKGTRKTLKPDQQ